MAAWLPSLIAPFLLAAWLLHQPRLPVAANAAAGNNLTAGKPLTQPGYITSPSGVFAFGFRALRSDPSRFILATRFRLDGDGDGDSSSSKPQSMVWFAKPMDAAPTPSATARSVLSITAIGQLALADTNNGSNGVLCVQFGSVLI